MQGINVDIRPEYNVHGWMDRDDVNFNPAIAEAVFHYGARADKDERFELCISTPEMSQAGNTYTSSSLSLMVHLASVRPVFCYG
jgi:hypothetical protein